MGKAVIVDMRNGKNRDRSANFIIRTSKLALSICLASWFGLFPIVQVAHITFANHDHRFCQEHQRIEDVPRMDDLDLHAMLPSGTSAQSMPTPQRGMQSEAACPILNCSTVSGPVLTSCEIALRLTKTILSPLKTSSIRDIPLQSPLIVAPKTSPPLAEA